MTVDSTLAVAAARLGVGAGTWIAPERTVRLFGLDVARQDPFVGRLFAARDFALGVAVLDADAGRSAAALRLSLAIDIVDLVAVGIGVRSGRLPMLAAVLTGAAAAGTAAGAVHSLIRGAEASP